MTEEKNLTPLSIEGVAALFNKAFHDAGYEEKVSVDQIRGAYEITTSTYDILGLAPIKDDSIIQQILRWIPEEKNGRVIIASLRVDYKSCPGDFTACNKPTSYWVFDFDIGEVMTELDAYKRYYLDSRRKSTRA